MFISPQRQEESERNDRTGLTRKVVWLTIISERSYVRQEWLQGTRYLGNTADSATDLLLSLQLLIVLPWLESNFRKVTGMVKGGKATPQTKRSLSTCPSPGAGGQAGRFWFLECPISMCA